MMVDRQMKAVLLLAALAVCTSAFVIDKRKLESDISCVRIRARSTAGTNVLLLSVGVPSVRLGCVVRWCDNKFIQTMRVMH